MIKENLKSIIIQKTPLDTIIETFECGDYIEVTGRAGGDILTYRIYSNGQVVER